MIFNKVFWPVFRVSWIVSAAFWSSILAVRTFPPQDGNYAREFGGSLAICASMVVVFWAFVPEAWWGGKSAGKLHYPVRGETWTFQSCMKHGCPSSFPYDWKLFPVSQSCEVTEIRDFYKELVDCGCFELGKTKPRLHDPHTIER